MDAQDIYAEYYAKISPRSIEWRELSGRIKAKNIINIVGDRKFASILEIGAGTGAILGNLSKAGFASKYYALDISEQAIIMIKNREDITGLMEAKTYDGLHLPYQDQQFDLAILSHVVEHLQDPAALLVEAARVARFLVVEVPLEDNLYTHIKVNLFKSHYREEIGHIQWFNQQKFSNLLSETCNFNILAIKMAYLPDEVHYFYKGSGIKIIKRLSLSVRKTMRAISPSLYSCLLTDHCIALVNGAKA